MILKQIRSTDDTGTLSYLIVDEDTRNAVVIDPNIEDLQSILDTTKDTNAHITQVIDTHTHADHVSAAGELKRLTGAKLVMHENTKNKWKIVDQGDKFGIGDILRKNAAFEVDRFVNDGDEIVVGQLKIRVLFTPGHTDNHISLLLDDNVFTGDLLLIGQAGRSDLPGGNPREQYDSLFNNVLNLPDATKIYPGHDYEENTFSYLHEERRTNPFLQSMTEEEYVKFVGDFFPPAADASDGGKVTLQCGTKRVSVTAEGFRNITPKELAMMMKKDPSLYLLDVREPFELMSFGAIAGVKNISINEVTGRISELPPDKTKPIVVICQSGNRSYEVAHYLVKQGYTQVHNLESGTSGWVMSGNSVTRGAMKAGAFR
jgi:sulfur dioxygenase